MSTSYSIKNAAGHYVILIIYMLISCMSLCVADELSKINGRVIDINGEPVDGVSIALFPVTFRDGRVVPLQFTPGLHYPSFQPKPQDLDDEKQPDFNEIEKRLSNTPLAKTDADGQFNLSKVYQGAYQVEIGKEKTPSQEMFFRNTDIQIYMIQIGEAQIFPQMTSRPDEKFVIGIKPETNIDNIEITVKYLKRLEGKIVFKDGTPFPNKRFQLNLRYCQLDGTRHNILMGSVFTDIDGNFVYYINQSGVYTLYASYLRHNTVSGFVNIGEKNEHHPVVLSFDDITQEQIPTESDMLDPVPMYSGTLNVWVINPENQHVYKKISCKSWDDAHTQAANEDAHLVTINSESEQIWLEAIFKRGPSWIGLTDIETEGEWKWDTGEPLTYTNWIDEELHPNDLEDSEKNYAIISYREGKWDAVGRGHPAWRSTRTAIIEKDGLKAEKPLLNR